MRIQSIISGKNLFCPKTNSEVNFRENDTENVSANSYKLSGMNYAYFPNINFSGHHNKRTNDWSVRKLSAEGIPCMYCGRELINAKDIRKLSSDNAFSGPLQIVLLELFPFKNSLHRIPAEFYNILEGEVTRKSNKNLQETIQELSPIHKRNLRKAQYPIFEELKHYAKELPEEYKYKFELLMQETNDKLKSVPIEIPFSPKEFSYKLERACKNVEDRKKVEKIVNMARNIPVSCIDEKNKLNQEQMLRRLEKKIHNAKLKERPILMKLCATARKQINNEKVVVPFNRKSFIYDLEEILEGCPNIETRENMLLTAMKFPTSRNNISAFIVKHESSPADIVIYDLLHDSFSTIEHIKPHTCGGDSVHSNYGHACTKDNSSRQHTRLDEFLDADSERRVNLQRYIDRLIELANDGTFKKLKIPTTHVENIVKTIETESQNTVKLDKSKLPT